MRLTGLLRSAAVRFAVLYGVVFGFSAIALAVFLWWQTAGLLSRETDDAINADVLGLAERWNEGGTQALVATLHARLDANLTDTSIYLLTDAAFAPVLGNLSRWPTGVTMTQDWFELPVERNGTRSLARIHRFDLADGFHLLVGRDAAEGAQLRALLTGALLWSMLVVLVLGLAGAVVMRGVFRRSLAGVFATSAAISAGDLDRRVPRSGRGDEFDTLAETINTMLDRIARLVAGVRQVTDAIAHDLRTPITRARMRLEDAALHAEGEAALHAAIARAQQDLDGVIGIFQALLRISEIEAGAGRSAFQRFDVVAMLRDLAEFYEAVAEDRGCTLRLTAPDRAWLTGDPALVQQAVANLVENALKFSPAGGAITLEVSRATAPDSRPDWRIAVRDTGPGMNPADLAQATVRFFRAEAARSTPGSGLGLSLVQAVAQLHGGTLRLSDAQPGLCATMVLSAGDAG